MFSDLKPPSLFKRELNLSQRLVQLTEIALGRKINIPPPPLPLERKYRDLAKIALPKNNYVGIAPGAGDISKCWHLKNFLDVAKDIVQKKRIPVFFLGPKEKKLYNLILCNTVVSCMAHAIYTTISASILLTASTILSVPFSWWEEGIITFPGAGIFKNDFEILIS